jgi:hypothetical protein
MVETPVGTYVANELEARKKTVAATRNTAGYAAIYPQLARDVVAKYPNLTKEEKAAVRATLQSDASSLGHDATIALDDVSRILGK